MYPSVSAQLEHMTLKSVDKAKPDVGEIEHVPLYGTWFNVNVFSIVVFEYVTIPNAVVFTTRSIFHIVKPIWKISYNTVNSLEVSPVNLNFIVFVMFF